MEEITAATRSMLRSKGEYKHYPFLDATDSWWELAPILRHSVEALLMDKFMEVFSIAGLDPFPAEIKYNDAANEAYIKGMAADVAFSRVSKVKNGYAVYIPLITNLRIDLTDMAYKLGSSNWRYKDEATKEKVIKAFYKILSPILGKEYFTQDVASDIILTPDMVVKNYPKILSQEAMQQEVNAKPEDEFKAGKKAILGFRFISTPLESSTIYKVGGGDEEKDAEEAPKLSMKSTRSDLVDFVSNTLSRRNVTVLAELFVSKECAEFITNSDPGKVRLSDLNYWVQQFGIGLEGYEWQYEINPIKNIDDENKLNPDYKKAKPKSNKEGLVMTEKGTVLYIPNINNVDAYTEYLDSFGLTSTGEYCNMDLTVAGQRHKDEKGRLRHLPSNAFVYTDWINNKIAFTNTNGVLRVLDADAFVPFTAGHAHRFLTESMVSGDHKQARMQHLDASLNRYADSVGNGAIVGIFKKLSGSTAFLDEPAHRGEGTMYDSLVDNYIVKEDFSGYIQAVFLTLERYSEDNKESPLAEYANYTNYSYDLLTADSPIVPLRPLGIIIDKALKYTLDNIAQVLVQRSVEYGLAEIGTLICVSKYAPKAKELYEQDKIDRKNYIDPPLENMKTYVPAGIPMVKGLSMLPHQAKVFNYLKNAPDNAILDVDAGGGKTILILSDILQLLGRHLVTRPIVVTLPHLIKDYISEANNITQGRLNIIPIDSSVLRSWGEEKLSLLISKAPINTIVVTSFKFLQSTTTGIHMRNIAYGNTTIELNMHVEFLRGLGFDGIWVDEVHIAKNVNTGYNKGLFRLMTDINIKRAGSGTLISNILSDVAGEFKLFDPSVFGDITTFDDKYGAGKGGSYEEGTEEDVRNTMSQYANVISARRKEWASLLPERKEYFYPVELTALQRKVYDTVLEDTIDKIEQFLKENPKIKAKMDSQDEDTIAAVERMLQTQMWRLEQYLAAPDKDPSAKGILETKEDIQSPKGKAVIEIFKKHEKDKCPGKILVYTSYRESAKTIYEQLPADVKAQTLHFDVQADPDATIAKFTRDPKYRMLVGSEKNLNTGRNLQFCDTLIRIESVWSPGNLEQGESRINRPNLKKGQKDPRPFIYFYWIVANRTIDITKLCRLITKQVSSVKFKEAGNPAYQKLESLPTVSMSLDSIRARNDFKDPDSLGDYIKKGYEPLKQLEQEGYDEYRSKKDFRAEMIPIKDGEILKGSRLLKHVPYCFHPDTLIETNKGRIEISELLKEANIYKILSFNHKTKEVEYIAPSIGKQFNSEEDMYEIEYDGGSLRVTENHEIWSVTRGQYVKAKDLQEGEELLGSQPSS